MSHAAIVTGDQWSSGGGATPPTPPPPLRPPFSHASDFSTIQLRLHSNNRRNHSGHSSRAPALTFKSVKCKLNSNSFETCCFSAPRFLAAPPSGRLAKQHPLQFHHSTIKIISAALPRVPVSLSSPSRTPEETEETEMEAPKHPREEWTRRAGREEAGGRRQEGVEVAKQRHAERED